MSLLTALLAVLICGCACTAAYYEPPPPLSLDSSDNDASAAVAALLLPSRFRPVQQEWALDPRLSLLAELGDQASRRVKRTGGGPSLSIVNPLDVLRQRLLLELKRRRMRESEDQIQANRELLRTIGKRSTEAIADPGDDEDDDDMTADANRSAPRPLWQGSPSSRWEDTLSSQHA